MCGIVAYVGRKKAAPIILKGLKRLEYRGYDSAGIALLNGEINIYKKKGKVADLEKFVKTFDMNGTIGMGHTRWATHGEPNDANAHPHTACNNDLAIIHNGIIENYAALKAELAVRGHKFHSETDTEILLHLIEEIQNKNNLPLEEAVRLALNEVIGAYGIVVLSKNEPNKIIAARKGSPLVIGVGKGEYLVASDATPIIEYTKDVVFMNDNEIAVLKPDSLTIRTIQNVKKTPFVQTLEMEIEAIEKSGFPHFMLKEIFEQPNSIADSMRGRLNVTGKNIRLMGLKGYEDKLANAKRIVITACGTSWHAGMVGEYLFEDLARIPVEVEYASEFRYRNPIIRPDDIIICISQSGETADTLAAVYLAKEHKAAVLGICNVVGSGIPRVTDAGVYTHAGPEIGVASTKAFTAQVTILALMAMMTGKKKGCLSDDRFEQLINALWHIPGQAREILDLNNEIKVIAEIFKNTSNFLYLGRGYNFPVAMEGALKLKEISYIHAEGYPAAEMKHGPIALIDENMPVVFVATHDSSYEKIISNIQEVKARKGRVIAIATKGDTEIRKLAEFVIEIPETDEALTPLLSVIPLQLLAYHVAVLRGCNVDQPRNLAKSVTVE